MIRVSPEIRYETRNGRTYAYRSTSKYVPGRKSPVSVKEYLGVIDPETGEIRAKNARVEPRAPPMDGARIVDYGNVMIANSIAERIGIREDLRVAFGDKSRDILALALAQAIHPTSSDSIDVVLNSSFIPDLLGLDHRISRADVRRIVNSMDVSEIAHFSILRSNRLGGKVYAYLHPLSDQPNALASDYGPGVTRRTFILMVMSVDGSPLGCVLVGDVVIDTTKLRHVLRMISDNVKCVFLSTPNTSRLIDPSFLIRDNIDFIISYDSFSEQFQMFAVDFDDIEDPQYVLKHGSGTYYLKEGTSALLQTAGSVCFIQPSDPRFGDCSLTFRSFMFLDSGQRSRAVDKIWAEVSDVRSQLDGFVFENPDDVFKQHAGSLERILKYDLNRDGAMRVAVRRKEMARVSRNLGKTLVISSSETHEDLIAARIARYGMTRAIYQFNGDSDFLRLYIGKGVKVRQHLFIEFLAMSIYFEIQRLLDRERSDSMDVRAALLIASSYKAIVMKDRIVRGSRDRRLPGIFRALGVSEEDPDRDM